LWRRALVEGREPQHDRLANRDVVDVLGLDLDLNGERVGLRHDHHDRVARRDDTADGVGGGLENNAVLRGTKIGALELIFGGHLALDILAYLAVGLAQFLGDVAGNLLIDLKNLQLDFGDLAFGLGGGRNQLTALASYPRRVALQRSEPSDRN